MAKIFISYRRDDSAYATGVIRDQLASRLRDCEIFLDVDSIPYGVDFRRHLEASVEACDYLVAVIGKRWLTAVDARGQRRLDDPNDAVRVEVETALRREIPLIPIFLDGMQVPTPDELPDSLRQLVSRNAIFVRPPPDFNRDIATLVESFQRHLGQEPARELQPFVGSPATELSGTPRRTTRRNLIACGGLLGLSALGGWRLFSEPDGLPEYEIAESYFFADTDPTPDPWKPRTRMLGGGFKLPVHYVHWVVIVKHAKKIAPAKVPLRLRLLDEQGEDVVEFDGMTTDLRDETYPQGDKTEWIFSVHAPKFNWQPGKYTVQLDTPTMDKTATFEIFP